MRGFIWGTVFGLAATVAVGHAIAIWNCEWPYHANKTASQAAMDLTRTVAPFASIIGGIVGCILQKLGLHCRQRT